MYHSFSRCAKQYHKNLLTQLHKRLLPSRRCRLEEMLIRDCRFVFHLSYYTDDSMMSTKSTVFISASLGVLLADLWCNNCRWCCTCTLWSSLFSLQHVAHASAHLVDGVQVTVAQDINCSHMGWQVALFGRLCICWPATPLNSRLLAPS